MTILRDGAFAGAGSLCTTAVSVVVVAAFGRGAAADSATVGGRSVVLGVMVVDRREVGDHCVWALVGASGRAGAAVTRFGAVGNAVRDDR
ncbi:hypothetical protein [Mycolicibacterium sp. CR10]|uniref:hypothetical protein n=1 Tax=Mycolicibacterium sp. CR10 TaxID=2562314 RepID=UPI0010C11C21|nr:hypothetical protein [Mycolicibacterium sp. CR10]